jgi:CRP/FNR family transcriptional regulator, anaerobic regulatory protein
LAAAAGGAKLQVQAASQAAEDAMMSTHLITTAAAQNGRLRGAVPDFAVAPTAPASAGSLSILEDFIGAPVLEWAPCGVSPYPLVHVQAGHALFRQQAPARSIYLVQSGDLKLVHVAEDGYEHVLDFLGRGDVLGLDGLEAGRHVQGAVALDDAWVYAMPLAALRELSQRTPGFATRLLAAVARQLGRSSDIAWLMAAVGSDRRTARFVLHWARRMAQRGQSDRRLLLRMSRRDIASHLGLAHESISRSFSVLADAGLLCVDNREIEILDAEGLRRFALCTRGSMDGVAARMSVRHGLRPAPLAMAA